VCHSPRECLLRVPGPDNRLPFDGRWTHSVRGDAPLPFVGGGASLRGAAMFPLGIGNPLRFMSREMDPSNVLYYVRPRWYDLGTQRFVSEDSD
jgi:RHS repeat-associated protein